MNKIAKILACGVPILLISACSVNELLKYRAGEMAERQWQDRVHAGLKMGITRSDAEAVLKDWGLSPYWNPHENELTAGVGVDVRYFLVDYCLGLELSFNSTDELIHAQIKRLYSLPM